MTNAELAILSLLAEKPGHGYEIEQTIEARGMRDWTEVGFSSIYFLLNKLQTGGLVSSGLEQPGGPGPARRVYTLTPKGTETYRAALREALSTPRRAYPPIQLGLANLPSLPADQSLASLHLYAQRLVERQEAVCARRDREEPDRPSYVAAMFEYSLAMLAAELAWIEAFIKKMEAS